MDLGKFKNLIANDDARIELHDIIVKNLRKLISELEGESFSTDRKWSVEEFEKQVKRAEKISSDLCSIQMLLSYWGSEEQKQNHSLALNRISNSNREIRGNTIWIALRWYPVLLLLYCGGISATIVGNYIKLYGLMNLTVYSPTHPHNRVSLIQAITNLFHRLNGDPFEIFLENKNHSAPRSEYLFETLKPKFEELFYLGNEYESVFDRFEVLLALEYAHQQVGESPERIWGPIGRFGSKYYNENPIAQVIEEAEKFGSLWPPIKAGFFGFDYERFKLISGKFNEMVQRLGLY